MKGNFGRGIAAACTLACTLVVLGAGSAGAKVDVTSIVARPIDAGTTCTTGNPPVASTQAGAHKDFCMALAFNGGGDPHFGDLPGLGDDPKDMVISLPAGLVGNPTATATCTAANFEHDRCPAAAQVGEVTASVDAALALSLNEGTLKGKVFNLLPTGTEPSKLGILISAHIAGLTVNAVHLESNIRLRPEDGGLDSLVVDSPRDLEGLPIELRRLNLTLWGSKSEHPSLAASYMANPTDCSHSAVTKLQITSYAGDVTTARASFDPTDCATLDFQGGSIFKTETQQTDAPTGLTAGVTIPSIDEPRVLSQVKRTIVTLPEGVELSPSAGSNPAFTGCSDAQFGRFNASPVTCPEGSKMGTIRFRSPLLLQGELKGYVYEATSVPGKPKIRLFAMAEAGPQQDALRIKLDSFATVNPDTGQITTHFEGIPPVPYTLFELSFKGGPTAVLSSPRKCGTYTASTYSEPSSGGAPLTTTASVDFNQGCQDPQPFAPTFGATVSSTQAGADTSIITTFERPDRGARISSTSVELPPGLAGRLTAVPLCPAASAIAGTCGPASRVGSVIATAGPGTQPLELGGDVFLAEGTNGSLATLSIVNRAIVGPLDFGKIVTLGRITVRPADIGLTLTVDKIPQRQEGVATGIRALKVTLDKPGFSLNATNCKPQVFTSTLGSDLGQQAALTAPYQATGCDQLPFKPKLTATIGGGAAATKKGGKPSLTTVLTQTPGEASSARAEVLLPAGVGADSKTLSGTCPIATYESAGGGACPAASLMGTASAESPLLPDPLKGNVYFVSVPGVPLPELRIELHGQLNIALRGKVQIGPESRLMTVIDPIPDTPLSKFTLTIAGGPTGKLINAKDICADSSSRFEGTFTSQAGGTFKSAVAPEITGCTPTATLKVSSLKRGSPSLDLRVTGGRATMNSVKLGIPKGLLFAKAQAVKSRVRVSTTGGKGTATIKVTKQGLTVTLPSGVYASTLRVRLAKGAVRVSKRLRGASKPKLAFGVTTILPGDVRASTRVSVNPAAR